MTGSNTLHKLVKDVCPTNVSDAFLDYCYKLAENVISYDREIDYQFRYNLNDEERILSLQKQGNYIMDCISYHYMAEDAYTCVRCALKAVMKYKSRGFKHDQESGPATAGN